jgi:hypothetical protein
LLRLWPIASILIVRTATAAQFHRGHTTVQITAATTLNCSVSYAGIAQSHLWLADPDLVQNARRAVYEAFDPKLETLKDIIGAAQSRGQVARDLEAAVAPDVEAAERLGISVMTREGLEKAIERTLIQPNADQVYTEAEQAATASLAKYTG